MFAYEPLNRGSAKWKFALFFNYNLIFDHVSAWFWLDFAWKWLNRTKMDLPEQPEVVWMWFLIPAKAEDVFFTNSTWGKKGYKKGYINQIVNDRRVILKIVNFSHVYAFIWSTRVYPFLYPFSQKSYPFCTPFWKSFYNTNHHSQPHSVDFVGFSRFKWKTLDYWMP